MSDDLRISLSLIPIRKVSYISGHKAERHEEVANEMKRSTMYKEKTSCMHMGDVRLQVEDVPKVAVTGAGRAGPSAQPGCAVCETCLAVERTRKLARRDLDLRLASQLWLVGLNRNGHQHVKPNKKARSKPGYIN